MTASEFQRKVKKLAKKGGLTYRKTTQGKGDHSRIEIGDRWTTLPDEGDTELKKGTFHAMCKQLGIKPQDL